MSTSDQLPRSTPEAQGIPSAVIRGFVDTAERTIHELHSFMLLRHGHVVAAGWWEPYRAEQPHMLFSVSKSFTAAAIGLAVAEGRLSVDDQVLAFFPDESPAEVSEHLAAMRVKHLLAMSTGHVVDTTPALHTSPDGNWARAFLACPVERAPGSHFLYNTGASYMLAAIVQRLTGETLLNYLRPRLLDPLGIEQASWERCPRGINTGGYGLSITTEAIARFGQLYLQRGMWQGNQILAEDWVAASSSLQTPNGDNPLSDWEQGYGYQFWRCRHNVYRGDGAFGQYCVIMPDQDAVLAITGGLRNMQPVLDLVWEQLLPAMGPAPLAADAAAHGELAGRLAGLIIAPPEGQPTPALAAEISGRTYSFAENQLGFAALSLEFDGEGCTLNLRDKRGEQQIQIGDGVWRRGGIGFVDRGGYQPVAAAGAWTSDDSYLIKAYYYQTPFAATFRCRFDRAQLLLDFSLNASFGPTEFPQMVGQASE